MKIVLSTLLLVLVSVSLKSQSYTQKMTSVDSTANIELAPAIIKSNRIPLLSERNKLSIQGASIQRQNVTQDIPFILNQFSSVVVNSDAGTGTGYTGIRIRGTDLTRINVSLNGIPVNDPESQNTFFVNMPDLLGSTQEIQLSKGVGSSKSGVGNFGGAIAIQSLDVNYQKPILQLQTDMGSFNTFKQSIKTSTGLINDKCITTLRLSSIRSDGYIDRSAANLKGMQWTTKYHLNKKTQLVFNYLSGEEKTGQAWNGITQDSIRTNRTFNELGLKRDGSYYNNQTDNYKQQYYQLFLDKKISRTYHIGTSLFYTRGKGYYEEYKLEELYSDYKLPNAIIGADTLTTTDLIRQLWLDNHFYGMRAYVNKFSALLDWGLYLNYSDYRGRHLGDVIWAQYSVPNKWRWYDLDARKKEYNAYAMFDYRFRKNYSLLADIQVRQVNYNIYGFRKNPLLRPSLNFLFFNPKVKLSYQGKDNQASLLMGIAQKEPNREDIESSVETLPRPEKLFNAELNYSHQFKKQFVVHATGFLMYYLDQLVLTGKINDVGAYTRTNTPKSSRIGLEVDVRWKPIFNWMEASANLSISANKINSFTEYIDDYDQGGQIENNYRYTDISFSPSTIIGAQCVISPFKNSINKWHRFIQIDLSGKYVGKQFLDNTSNASRQLKAYFVSDLMFNFPFQIKYSHTIKIRAGIYNLLNTLYEANGYSFSYKDQQQLITRNYYFPQAGRRWNIGIGIDL